MAAPRTPAPGRLVRCLAVGLVPAAMTLAGGCSLGNDLASGVTAPLAALPLTDVVVETNLETDLNLLGATAGLGGAGGIGGGGGLTGLGGLGITGLGASGAGGGAGGNGGGGGGAPDGFVTGPSTGPSITSYAAPRPGVVVIVAWNNVSRDCLGIVKLAGSLSGTVLGLSTPGTYYLVVRKTPSSSCVASAFADTPTKPSGWPAGEPSSAGFPAT